MTATPVIASTPITPPTIPPIAPLDKPLDDEVCVAAVTVIVPIAPKEGLNGVRVAGP